MAFNPARLFERISKRALLEKFLKFGRFAFAISTALWGLQLLLFALSMKWPLPTPPWSVGSHFWVYPIFIVLIAGSIGLASSQRARAAAILLGTLILLRTLLVYIPAVVANVGSLENWTNAFELLAMCGSSFVIAEVPHAERKGVEEWMAAFHWTTQLGRVCFAGSLAVFGAEHLLYARSVGDFIPSWIPWHLFWAYFVGVAFIAASISIITNRRTYLAGTLLGVMFLLWVLVLWTPAILAHPRNGGDWTNAFLTLALAGGALTLADASRWPPVKAKRPSRSKQ